MSYFLDFQLNGLAGRNKVYAQSLRTDINVFFGPNGIGKTTLLRALYSAMKNDADLIEGAAIRGGQVNFFSEDLKLEIKRTLRPVKSKSQKNSGLTLFSTDEVEELDGLSLKEAGSTHWKWQTTTEIQPKKVSIPRTFRCKYLPVSRLYTSALQDTALFRTSQQLSDPAELEPRLESSFVLHVQILWREYANHILNEIRQAQQLGLSKILQTVLSTTGRSKTTKPANPDSAYELAQAFLQRQHGSKSGIGSKKQFTQRYLDRPHLQSVIEDIREIEAQISTAQRAKVELQDLLDALFAKDGKRVTLSDNGIEAVDSSGNPITLDHLSSGEKQILKLYIECITARNGPLIIDEPEISLHIDWQRRLLSTLHLLNPRAQIIVATHSPEIMAEIDDDKIFRV